VGCGLKALLPLRGTGRGIKQWRILYHLHFDWSSQFQLKRVECVQDRLRVFTHVNFQLCQPQEHRVTHDPCDPQYTWPMPHRSLTEIATDEQRIRLFFIVNFILFFKYSLRCKPTGFSLNLSLYLVWDCGTLCLDYCVALVTTLLAWDILWRHFFLSEYQCIQRRQTDCVTCAVRRTRTTYSDRCFAVAGPQLWNSANRPKTVWQSRTV